MVENTREQDYAHFHRLLGELHQAWVQDDPDPLWLSDKTNHDIHKEHKHNNYARVAYRLESLEPYKAKLENLEHVQKKLLKWAGYPKRTPNTLLLPQIAYGVTHLRLHQQTFFVGVEKSRQLVITQLQEARDKVEASFEKHALQGFDDKTRSIEAELQHLVDALKTLENDPPDTKYWVRVQQHRYRPYLYFQNGSASQIDTREHGLVLVGHNIQLLDEHPLRRPRNDKVNLEPLAHFGQTTVYRLDDWQQAKAALKK